MDWSTIGVIFTEINIFNFGYELLPLAVSLLLAIMVAKNKKQFGLAFTLMYLFCFIIGWAKEVWILVVLGFLAGLYLISAKYF